MKFLQYTFFVLFALGLPMLTSWLLDIPWITEKWSRSLLVHLLMLLEFAIGAIGLVLFARSQNKNS